MTPFATTLAPWQVAQLWADLEDAYHGRASHGDTAEVYAYRLLPYDPSLAAALTRTRHAGDEECIRDNAGLARDALVAVGRAFETRRNVKLEIDGYWTLGAYAAAPGFTHRVHVQVKK